MSADSGAPPLPDAGWAWEALGIAPTGDESEVRRAYARRLKAIDPDSDPQAFIALREARDFIAFLAWRAAQDQAEPAEAAPSEPEPPPTEAPTEAPIAAPDPAPGPEPEVRTEFARPAAEDEAEIDPELFRRIDRLLYGPDAVPDFAELRAAAEDLFAHPGLDRIGMAESVENWVINAIVATAPRSDALVAPAVARFRWDEGSPDWRRPPVLDWIVQRRLDADFERSLVADFPGYGEVLRYLRDPDAAPPARPGLGLAADMRAFLLHARANHPTTIALCDAQAVQWWEGWVLNPPGFLRRELEAVHRIWYGRDRPDGLFQPRPRPITGRLLVGIIFLPIIFAWGTIRPGNRWFVRLASIAWMALWFVAVANYEPPPPEAPHAPPALSVAPPSTFAPGRDATADIDRALSRYDDPDLVAGALERRNPALYARLTDLWRSNQESNAPYSAFSATAIWDDYRAGVRGGDYEIQAAYWHLRADILSWMANDGSEGRTCDAYLNGTAPPLLHPVFVRRTDALVARVLLRPGRRDVPELAPGRTWRFDIPDAVFDGAMARARLDRATLGAALRGGGTPVQRCVARIAIIESALALPSMRMTPFIREMSRGL
jgi:hypothetical protein